MDKEMDEFYGGIYVRVRERISSMNLSAEARDAKLAKYAELFEGDDVRLSAISIQNIATDLMTTYHWVISGEHEAEELRFTVRNVVRNGDGTGGNADWVLAEEVLRDAEMAYRQVAPFREPLTALKSVQDGSAGEALQCLRDAMEENPELDFFDAVEKFFGVEIIVLESEKAFDAIGAVISEMAFIVVNSKHSVSRIHYAVACELAMIVTGNLALYSDIFAEDFPEDYAVGEFMEHLIRAFSFGRAASDDTSVLTRRFPAGLVEAHREAVAKHGNLGFFLEWMTGEKPVRSEPKPLSVDELMELFDFKD